jgi:hypothetical protein
MRPFAFSSIHERFSIQAQHPTCNASSWLSAQFAALPVVRSRSLVAPASGLDPKPARHDAVGRCLAANRPIQPIMLGSRPVMTLYWSCLDSPVLHCDADEVRTPVSASPPSQIRIVSSIFRLSHPRPSFPILPISHRHHQRCPSFVSFPFSVPSCRPRPCDFPRPSCLPLIR